MRPICKILMVEDHEIFARNVIREFLSEHEVTVVSSVEAARREFEDAPFDVLLVDYDLEDDKGDEFVRWVRARFDSTRIVATSSHDYGNEMLEAAGADAVCSKMDFGKIGAVLAAIPLVDSGPNRELEYAIYTEGHGAENEDRVAVFEQGTRLVAVVVDGAGGTGGGREAAEFVVERVRKYAETLIDAASVVALLHTIDSELLRSTADECAVVVLFIHADEVRGASVGDCEAWAFSDTALEALTSQQVRKPLLGSGEARATPFSAQMRDSLLIAARQAASSAPLRSGVRRALCSSSPSAVLCAARQKARVPHLRYELRG